MHPILKTVLGLIAGLLVGGIVNMGIILISGSIIPAPNGADVTTVEGLKATIHLFEPKHFLFPFLAHALGTLVSALIAVYFATSHKLYVGLGVGIFYLIGGITMILSVPAPMWFNIVDAIGAYLPMGYLGYLMVGRRG